ncbi:MAG: DNA polymerase IV [Chloroflexi bacterium]|nr:DNA polymerase IV [Chloroflexota bacterium]
MSRRFLLPVRTLKNTTSRIIMHVDLDAFFVSVEQVLNPELQGKAVVVGGRPGGRGVVAAASYEARAFGVHSAMPLKTASRLCPQAIFIEGSFPRYRAASQRFMAILADFSPFIEPLGLDEAYLDVTGFESIYGSIPQMAIAIKQRVKGELGLGASVGIASCQVVAKVASDLSKPDGLVEVGRGEERAFLAPLLVAKLPGIGKKTGRILESLGIHTIGELAVTPLSLLKSHFGVSGEVLHRSANGIDDRKVEPPAAAKSISRETTFAQDTKDRVLLRATLRYLGERVGADLRGRGKQAGCLTLKLRYADFTTITRSYTLRQTTDSDQTIFQTGVELLDRALSGEKQPVRLIGIGVSSLVEPGRQLALLEASAPRLEQLNKAIDRIRNKYGFTAIQSGQTLRLKDLFPSDDDGYTIHTPSLSR